VLEGPRLLLGEDHHLAGSLGESLEHCLGLSVFASPGFSFPWPHSLSGSVWPRL
jgi:hypothetical protein